MSLGSQHSRYSLVYINIYVPLTAGRPLWLRWQKYSAKLLTWSKIKGRWCDYKYMIFSMRLQKIVKTHTIWKYLLCYILCCYLKIYSLTIVIYLSYCSIYWNKPLNCDISVLCFDINKIYASRLTLAILLCHFRRTFQKRLTKFVIICRCYLYITHSCHILQLHGIIPVVSKNVLSVGAFVSCKTPDLFFSRSF